MANFSSSIKGVFDSEHAVGALYVGLAAFVLADSVPTLGDIWTIEWQVSLRNKWKAGEISVDSYWKEYLASYYLPNILYWLVVLLVVVNIPGSAHKKFYVAIALISSGALVAVVYNLYNKDKRQQLLQDQLLIPKQ